jgi:hypothetical protein
MKDHCTTRRNRPAQALRGTGRIVDLYQTPAGSPDASAGAGELGGDFLPVRLFPAGMVSRSASTADRVSRSRVRSECPTSKLQRAAVGSTR